MYKHSLKFELTHWTHETQRNVYYAGADVYDDEVYSLLAWLETVSSSITLALGRKEAAETAGSAAVFSGCCDFTRITHPSECMLSNVHSKWLATGPLVRTRELGTWTKAMSETTLPIYHLYLDFTNYCSTGPCKDWSFPFGDWIGKLGC